jgi:phage-related protein
MTGAVSLLGGIRALITGFATSTISALAPILPVILAISAAILVLQHAWVHNWFGIRDATVKAIEGIKSAFSVISSVIKTFISGFIEPFRILFAPILETLGLFNEEAKKSSFLVQIVNAITGAFKWLYSVLEPHIPLIKQIIKIAGTLAAVFFLITNPIGQAILAITGLVWVFKKLREVAAPALATLKSAFDSTIGRIIELVNNFIQTIQQAWKAITENPFFKVIQTLFQFTPAGMAITTARTAYTAITEHRVSIPNLPELPSITPAATPSVQTVNVGGVKADVVIHLNDIRLDHTGRVKQLGIEVSKQLEETLVKAMRRAKFAKG